MAPSRPIIGSMKGVKPLISRTVVCTVPPTQSPALASPFSQLAMAFIG
jgi:hypothetical protein